MAEGETSGAGEHCRMGGKRVERHGMVELFHREEPTQSVKGNQIPGARPSIVCLISRGWITSLCKLPLHSIVSNDLGGCLDFRFDPRRRFWQFHFRKAGHGSRSCGGQLSLLWERNTARPWEASQKAYSSLTGHWKHLWIRRHQRFIF